MVSTLTVKIPKSSLGGEELVAVPRSEYERMREWVARKGPAFLGYEEVSWKGRKHKVPAYQLRGKAAERLDEEVREARAEYKAGKTKKIKSLADLD
ncbi:MAG: hypothetical protein AAB533_02880 [Patescibacteria group bacterium]